MRIHFFGGQLQKTIRLPIIIAKSKLIKQQIINGCQMLWKVMTSIINGFQRRIIKNQLHYSLLETFQAEQLWLILINFKIKQNIILFSSVLKCLLSIFLSIYVYILQLPTWKNVNCNLHTLQLQDDQNNKWCKSIKQQEKYCLVHYY